METSYEWDVETIDEHGDIQDHDHFDKLKDSYFFHDEINERTLELVLVRDTWNAMGQSVRTWAYMVNKKMPEFFQDAYQNNATKVPQRYLNEFQKWKGRQV